MGRGFGRTPHADLAHRRIFAQEVEVLQDPVDDILVFYIRHDTHGRFAMGADERVHLIYALDHGRPRASYGQGERRWGRRVAQSHSRKGRSKGRIPFTPGPGPVGVPAVVDDGFLVHIGDVEDDLCYKI